jgi:hypothetical protein
LFIVKEISRRVMHRYCKLPIVFLYKVGSSKEAPSKAERLVVVDIGDETSLVATMLVQ